MSDKLRKLRLAKCLNSEKLAKEIGVKDRTIISWEKGKSLSKLRNLIKLAKFFNVRISYLLGLED